MSAKVQHCSSFKPGDVSYSKMSSEISPPYMSTFSRYSSPQTKSSNYLKPPDPTSGNSNYSSRSLQRNKGTNEIDARNPSPEIGDPTQNIPESINQRFNRKPSIIRIDARNISREDSLKRKQPTSNIASTTTTNNYRYASVTRLTRDDGFSANQTTNLKSPHTSSHPPTATQNGINYNQSERDDRYSSDRKMSSTKSQKVDFQQNRSSNSRFDIGPTHPPLPDLPQNDTLPYNLKSWQNEVTPAKNNDYVDPAKNGGCIDCKSRSKVTFASNQSQAITKPEQSMKKQVYYSQNQTNTCTNQHICKERRNKRFWLLILLLIALLLCAVIMLAYFALRSDVGDTSRTEVVVDPKITTEKSCAKTKVVETKTIQTNDIQTQNVVNLQRDQIKIAERILSSLDPTVKPCDDFYAFSCGGWMSANMIPPQEKIFGVLSKISKHNDYLLNDLLGRNIDYNSNLTRAEEKAKKFYTSCLDIGTIEHLGADPLNDLLSKFSKFGGWNASGDWNPKTWKRLNDLIHECLTTLGLHVFFSVNILVYKNKQILNVNGPESIIGPSFFFTGEEAPIFEVKFKKGIKSLLKQLKVRNINRVVDDIYQVEKALAQRYRATSNNFELINIRRLVELCPEIDWRRILQETFPSTLITLDTEISTDKESEYYFKELSVFLNNTTSRRLNNYIMWKIVFSRSHRLSKPFRDASDFIYDLFGYDVVPSIWKECLTYAKDQFKVALGIMYVKERFSLKSKRKIEKMAENIKQQFQDNIKNQNWLNSDEPSREAIIAKINSTGVKLGFNKKFLEDPTALNDLYQFPVDQGKFFDNFLKSVEFKVKQGAKKLSLPVNKAEWKRGFYEADPVYSTPNNEIIFPAGLLQPPMFDPKSPDSFNYGAIGSMIGHELTHALDTFEFWSVPKNVLDTYGDKLDCVFNSYDVLAKNMLYGERTMEENVADLAGVKVAYEAYQKYGRKSASFIGNFTNDQLFFISFAQTWCTNRQEGSKNKHLEQGRHALEEHRVTRSLSHFNKFAEAFQCKKGDLMVSAKQCEVW